MAEYSTSNRVLLRGLAAAPSVAQPIGSDVLGDVAKAGAESIADYAALLECTR